jgi:hypothetical protein
MYVLSFPVRMWALIALEAHVGASCLHATAQAETAPPAIMEASEDQENGQYPFLSRRISAKHACSRRGDFPRTSPVSAHAFQHRTTRRR